MAITVIQSASAGTSANGTSVTITMPANTTAGNLLVVMWGTAGTPTFGGDPADTWTAVAGSPITNTRNSGMWYAKGIVGGKTTYTFTRSTSGSLACSLVEISSTTGWQTTPLDVSSNATNSAGTTIDTGTTAATTDAVELAIGGFWSDISGSTAPGAFTAYTNSFAEQTTVGGLGTNSNRVSLATKTLAATGTQQCQATAAESGNHHTGLMAVFRPILGGVVDQNPIRYGYGAN